MGVMGNDLCALLSNFFLNVCTEHVKYFPKESGLKYNSRIPSKYSVQVKKGKAVPLQAWTGPEGCRKLRFLDFVTATQDGGRLSALSTGRFYRQEIILVLISVRDLVDRKDFMSMKNPLTPAGIEPATFRFVAQHLNH